METKIRKWGNSFAVRIPKVITDANSLKDGVGVTVRTQGRKIIIEPVDTVEETSLKDLVSKITAKNRYELADWGGPVGKEIW